MNINYQNILSANDPKQISNDILVGGQFYSIWRKFNFLNLNNGHKNVKECNPRSTCF